MKKKIPELLDHGDEMVITGEIKDLFDPEEIKELTMNKIHQSGKHTIHTRKFAAVLFAAALALALTATAFAAYRYMVAGQFDGYFEDVTGQQAEVIEQLGTGEMPPSTANGTTLTPLAAIGDARHCYARFRLEVPEGTQFPVTGEELEFLHIYGLTEDERYSLVDENGELLPLAAARVQWIDSTPGDNILEFIVCFYSDMSYPARFNDGTSKILVIQGIWLEEPDKEYTKLLEGPWSFDIGFYGAAEERTLDVDGLDVKRLFNGAVYEDVGMSMTLRSMSLSPLALTYTCDFTSPDPMRVIPGPGTIYIVMKDGGIVEDAAEGSGLGTWTESHLSKEVLLQAPIDLDQVDYIQFGNQQIQVN